LSCSLQSAWHYAWLGKRWMYDSVRLERENSEKTQKREKRVAEEEAEGLKARERKRRQPRLE